jgi:alpha-glucosidase
MQWDTSNAQAGFSTNPTTWLPVPPTYTTVNVAAEEKDATSLLNWYKTLIAMRRGLPALHDGGIAMLDTSNPHVLSYVRTAPSGAKPVVVSLNMTAQPQVVHLDLADAGVGAEAVTTLLTNEPSLTHVTSVASITLPPYASYLAEVR